MKQVTKLETLKDLVTEHLDVAKEHIQTIGTTIPMVIGYSATSRILLLVPELGGGEEKKANSIKMISTVFAAYNVKRYTLSFIGWELGGENSVEEYDKLHREGKRITDHPDKVKVLSCLAVSKRNALMSTYEINKEGKVCDTHSVDGECGGLFAELLPKKELSERERGLLKLKLKKLGISTKEETLQ